MSENNKNIDENVNPEENEEKLEEDFESEEKINKEKSSKSSNEYEFKSFTHSELPSRIQYTPEYSENWIYSTGEKDGGSRDDVPIQGIELGIISGKSNIKKRIKSVLNGLKDYHDRTGNYPRHRIISESESFESVDDIGLVIILQPRPDNCTGLIEHMREFNSKSEQLNPNIQNARLLTSCIVQFTEEINSSYPTTDNSVINSIWPTGKQIGDTCVLQRYSSLGAGGIYDPTESEFDLNTAGEDDITQVNFTPKYIDIDSVNNFMSENFDEDSPQSD